MSINSFFSSAYSQVTIPSNFREYENLAEGIKIQYPSNWSYKEAIPAGQDHINIVTFFPPLSNDPNIVTTFQININPVRYNEPTLHLYTRSLIKNVFDNIGATIVTVNSDSKLSGREAFYLQFSYFNKFNHLEGIRTGTLVGDKEYALYFETDKSRFEGHLPDVEKMIKSFILNI